MGKLRAVKVFYNDGSSYVTSMAANLKDSEIRNYFSVGRTFNVGSVRDKMVKVKRIKIIQ